MALAERVEETIAESPRLDTPDIVATTRNVYDAGDTVIKVPQRGHLVEVNEDEVRNWEKCQDASILAPIVDYADDYQWVEMVKCHHIDDDALLNEYRIRLSSYEFDIMDLHIDNVGILPSSGEVVCYDYAAMDWD